MKLVKGHRGGRQEKYPDTDLILETNQLEHNLVVLQVSSCTFTNQLFTVFLTDDFYSLMCGHISSLWNGWPWMTALKAERWSVVSMCLMRTHKSTLYLQKKVFMGYKNGVYRVQKWCLRDTKTGQIQQEQWYSTKFLFKLKFPPHKVKHAVSLQSWTFQ